MAIEFIPTIWSARLLQSLKNALIYSQVGVVNKDYEGEIRDKGNTVKIASIGAITVADYVKNTDIADPEILSDEEQSLLIDQAKYFNFFVDAIDKVQANVPLMDAAMAEAAYALRSAQDTFVAATMESAVPSGNKIGAGGDPEVPTSETAYEYLVDLGTLLSEANVPEANRWAVVPPWFHGLLQKDDRFVKAGTAATDSVLRNGQIGAAAGFTVYQSNNVPNTSGTRYKIMAGHALATSVAEQIVSIETFKPEKRFGDAVKGLHVYGAKVVRPTCLAMLIANKS